MAAVKLLKFSSCSFLKSLSVRNLRKLSTATYAQTLLNIPETKVTTLENGFKIATEYSDTPCSTVGLWIDSGSRFESPESNGTANFVEHMAFKGTSKRSEKDLEIEIENMGAVFNSYTDREESAFYANCLPSDVPKVVDILADITQNSSFDNAKIEEERQNILKKLDEAESNLKLVTTDYLHLTAYQGTPLGQSVIGPSKNIKKISKEDLSFFVRNNFLAPRMVLAATGSINHDELVKLAEKNFSSVPLTYTNEIPTIKPCRFTGSEIRDRDDWMPFAHVAVAVDSCGHNSEDTYPLMLAKTHIGSWDKTLASSANTVNPLIQNIHGEPRCHSFEAFHIQYRDTGLWGIYFVMDGMVLDDFMYNLQNEWMKLCTSFTENDLRIAKNILKVNILQDLDGSTRNCADIGRQVLHYGKRLPLAEVDDKIESITLKQLKDVCSKYIYDRCPAIAAVGPIEAMTDYNRVRSNMYWLRY
ncbi:mitochondrial-processing peptidase subunit beta-like [Uloborus diversus]|uniref:mitochondrial-processing peptidase subunit beta-like n=1 Tax=Uloborus diversus TaxID=327109 RepID=UPI002409B99F|nr:mitochondrial-processing peptidase subunit beta-like [Uloborus diversus]